MKNQKNDSLNKSEISKEIKIYMNKDEFKLKIEKIVKDKMKNEKDFEDKIVEVTKNVITQLFKTLWLKKATWLNNLNNKKN